MRAANARKREERLKRERFKQARALNAFAIPDDCDYLLELILAGREARIAVLLIAFA